MTQFALQDPVTGSAHTVLAPYWAEQCGKETMLARQVVALWIIFFPGLQILIQFLFLVQLWFLPYPRCPHVVETSR